MPSKRFFKNLRLLTLILQYLQRHRYALHKSLLHICARQSKRYVQPKHSTTLRKFEKIYSLKFIKIISSIEFVLYIYLVFSRIRVINNVKRIPKIMRSLIDLFDYENGWNFIFLFLLFTSIILTFRKRRIAWILKRTGLICISTTLILSENYIGILTILLFIFYSTNKATKQFDISAKEKFWFFLIIIIAAMILLFCSMTFKLLKY